MLQPPEAIKDATEHVLATAQAFEMADSVSCEVDGNANAQQILARRLQAWDWRIEGLSYREIAKRSGVSPSTAYEDVQVAGDLIADKRKELAEKVLDIELERADKVCRVMLKRMEEKGDPRAAQAYLHAGEHRARLLGIYQPEKVLHAGMVLTEQQLSSSRSSLDEKLEQLRARMVGGAQAEAIDVGNHNQSALAPAPTSLVDTAINKKDG